MAYFDTEPAANEIRLIRLAKTGDEDAVVSLWDDCGLLTRYDTPRADFRISAGRGGSAILVAESHSGSIIGTAMVEHDGGRGSIWYVAVSRRYRNEGVGRAIIAVAEKWFGDNQITDVEILVSTADDKATGFYEQVGYRRIGATRLRKVLVPGGRNR